MAALCSHYVHIRNVFTAFHERKWVFPVCYESQKGFVLLRLPGPLSHNSISHFLRLASATSGPNRNGQTDHVSPCELADEEGESLPGLCWKWPNTGKHYLLMQICGEDSRLASPRDKAWKTRGKNAAHLKDPSSARLDHLRLSLPITLKNKGFHCFWKARGSAGLYSDPCSLLLATQPWIRDTDCPILPLPLLKKP